MVDTPVPASPLARPCARSRRAQDKSWRRPFLAHLAASSNVAASARAADVATSIAYEARRRDPQFYREWQEALCEGYEHLEMSLLQRLRDGEIKPARDAKKGVRVFDNATALRLLVVHRDSVSRQQAIRDNRDTGAILEAINARIDKMRSARAIEAQPAPRAGDDAHDDAHDDAGEDDAGA
jgi:hypothetical protein